MLQLLIVSDDSSFGDASDNASSFGDASSQFHNSTVLYLFIYLFIYFCLLFGWFDDSIGEKELDVSGLILLFLVDEYLLVFIGNVAELIAFGFLYFFFFFFGFQ